MRSGSILPAVFMATSFSNNSATLDNERTSEADTAAVLEVAFGKVQRRVIWLLFVLFVVAFLDRINIGFAAISMNRDLGLSAAAFGLAGTIMYAGYFLFEIPSNILLAKFGARRWISRIMISWGIASMATAAVTTDTGLYVVRLFVGIAEAGFLPGILLYLTYWIPAAQRGRATSFFFIAQPLAIGFGSISSGLIMAYMDGALGLAGWKWMFIVEGVPAVLLGLVVLRYLPDKPLDAKWLTPGEQRAIATAVAGDHVQIHRKSGGLGEFLVAPFLLLAFAYFALVTSLNALGTWSPLIIQEAVGKQASFVLIGLLSAIPGIAAAVAMPLWGSSSDRAQERAWHYVIPALVGVVGWITVTSSHATSVRVAGLLLATTGGFAAMPILWTIPATLLTAKSRPVGMAILSAIGILGSITSPAIVGFLKDATGRFDAGIWYACALLFVSVPIFFSVATKLAREVRNTRGETRGSED
jgi:ACS family 4-hydroxyphenylacetate permease-like MFS transporter